MQKKGETFEIGPPKPPGLRKTPSFFGPIKRAYFSPFVLVYGTQGDSAATEVNLHHARVQAQQWWRRANGRVDILPDTEVTSETVEQYNLILFGRPETNAITARVHRDLPILIGAGRVALGDRVIEGEGIGVQFIYPNPLNPTKFILVHGGTDPEGEERSTLFGTLYSGAGLCGFFDMDWNLNEKLMYSKK
ncbi:MAG: hypothetical protein ACE5OR_07430 [bacterium]